MKTLVGGVIRNSNGEFLLVKGRASGKWGIPKGHLEDDDWNIETGAYREIREETGLCQTDFTFLCHENIEISFVETNLEVLFLELSKNSASIYPKDLNEIESVAWWNYSSLEFMIRMSPHLFNLAVRELFKRSLFLRSFLKSEVYEEFNLPEIVSFLNPDAKSFNPLQQFTLDPEATPFNPLQQFTLDPEATPFNPHFNPPFNPLQQFNLDPEATPFNPPFNPQFYPEAEPFLPFYQKSQRKNILLSPYLS